MLIFETHVDTQKDMLCGQISHLAGSGDQGQPYGFAWNSGPVSIEEILLSC